MCVSLPTKLYPAGGDIHVTGNDVAEPQVTGSCLEVTSFDRKSPGSGCRKPKLSWSVRFTSYKAVT